ncbi:MAG: acylphosphatase [Nostocoides sp.]
MPPAHPTVRATVFLRGRVQGVGFRWWTRARALELGLAGHARNPADGRVEVVAQGSVVAVGRLHALLVPDATGRRRPGVVTACSEPIWSDPLEGATGFVER